MPRHVDKEIAASMLEAQSNGYGTIPANAEMGALLVEWEHLGWVASHIDSDGERVYTLTFAGRDWILGAPKESAVPVARAGDSR